MNLGGGGAEGGMIGRAGVAMRGCKGWAVLRDLATLDKAKVCYA